MKSRVSDIIIKYLECQHINTLFTLTGGFAMHLNDSFGRSSKFDIYYHHHEQACGYAALGYSKTNSKISVVCTTAGCAATNAITPCLVAYQDSLPLLFISGQVKSTETTQALNNDNMILRHYAGADADIISMVKPITKYAYEIKTPNEIYSVLKEAIENLINGRPGPVWLSIPVDIQGMLIEEEDIPEIKPNITNTLPDYTALNNIYNLLDQAERPLIIAGNGIKLGKCNNKFIRFINEYNIPVVVTFHGTDLIESEHNLCAGKIGLVGNRAGNFALQNCDLLISLGCRMSQGIIGYRSDWFAREAKIIYIDNDQNELEKK